MLILMKLKVHTHQFLLESLKKGSQDVCQMPKSTKILPNETIRYKLLTQATHS